MMEFTFKKVDSEELLNETYRVRYEVFCQECAFLPASDYPDGLETDEYDEHSIHFAALADGEVVGTCRLVMNSERGYPLDAHCKWIYIKESELPKETLVEVSRLALRRTFRRRRNDGLYGLDFPSTTPEDGKLPENANEMNRKSNRSNRPIIVLGLYRAMYHETRRVGFTHWFAAMEEQLWYSLKMFNFTFQKIGPEVDYYGPVTPYLGVIEELEKEVSAKSPDIWSYLLEGLEEQYWPEFMRSATNRQ